MMECLGEADDDDDDDDDDMPPLSFAGSYTLKCNPIRASDHIHASARLVSQLNDERR